MPGIYKDIEIRTLFQADDDYPRHSEATIVELPDGSLLMAWQRFERSEFGSGDQSPANICLANSDDGGRSWHDVRVGVARDAGSVNVYSPNLLRLQNGDIQLVYMQYVQLTPGLPALTTAYTIRSSDEGKTWSAPRTIWERTRYGFSNDCIRRLTSGRVILPVCSTEGEMWSKNERIFVELIYSDDDCETWRYGGQQIRLPMRGAMEPFLTEIGDGRLIMVMRSQLGSLFKTYSADEGLTWSKPQPTCLPVPESCPFIIHVPGSRKLLVVWNNAEYDMHWRSHYGKRSPLTAAVTEDGGETFTDFWDIETDPVIGFSNPGATWTRDGRCLLTYWACPYSPDWVMDGYTDLKLASFRIEPSF